jgi:hypothetical protein
MADTSQGVSPAGTTTGQSGAQPARPPAGRYGRTPAERSRSGRRGKRIYYAAVGLVVAVVVGIAWQYAAGSSVNGEVQTFQVVSDHAVKITLSVSRPSDRAASCTVRSRDADGNEVGRVTVSIPKGNGDATPTVLLKTTSRGTTGELVGCS